jgi:hypothetical protein
MLKMHNIIIDENKSIIANIDTLEKEKEGNLTFRCDYCKIKFDTRQQLRDHKRDIHNVVASANGGNTASSASSDCDASSKTPTSATNHLASFFPSQHTINQDVHHEDPSSSASSTAGTAGSNAQTSCHFCTETFTDNNKLTGHLMAAHYQELMNEFAKSNLPEMADEDDLVNQVAMQMARSNQVITFSPNYPHVQLIFTVFS